MRYLSQTLADFSKNKFVLLSGPRQVGKTTIAQNWLKNFSGLYLNWDVEEDRESILKRDFLKSKNFTALVLDELHKYSRWKSWLKGLYDSQHQTTQVVVTGSARLDVFQKSGDSLLGRYEYLRLHPLSIGELYHKNTAVVPPPDKWHAIELPRKDIFPTWLQLEAMSGFPEPYYKNDPLYYRRWSTRRRNLLVQEDLRELTDIRNITLVEHLAILLPERVSSTLSVNSLKEELQVAHDTVKSWLEVLERLYYCFRISPYFKRISRSLKKEQKLYLWDWSQVTNEAARFENMVASHLLKSVHAWTDMGYGEFALHYLRDKDKNEVDFAITQDRVPVVLIEAKLSEERPSSALIKFAEKLGDIDKIQLVKTPNVDFSKGNFRIVSADKFLAALN